MSKISWSRLHCFSSCVQIASKRSFSCLMFIIWSLLWRCLLRRNIFYKVKKNIKGYIEFIYKSYLHESNHKIWLKSFKLVFLLLSVFCIFEIWIVKVIAIKMYHCHFYEVTLSLSLINTIMLPVYRNTFYLVCCILLRSFRNIKKYKQIYHSNMIWSLFKNTMLINFKHSLIYKPKNKIYSFTSTMKGF